MISSCAATDLSFEPNEHLDRSLSPVIRRWFESIQVANLSVNFSVRPTQEQNQTAFGRAKRERDFSLGRECAAQLLRDFGTDEFVGVNDDRSPEWPEGTVGSISHSEHWTIACVASAHEIRSVGVDTEPIMSRETANLIADDIATVAEINRLRAAGFSKESALTLVFSAKESFYKCWYPITKRFLEFRDVEIVDATAKTLFVRGIEMTSNHHSELAVEFLLTDGDVFTFACVEGGR